MANDLGRPAEILYAEDNEDDVELIRAALARSDVPINLHHVEDGAECLRFLRRQGQHEHAPRPDLLLLDLNMPVKDGYEVIQAIVADTELQWLPVVILTTSAAPDDIRHMYCLRCSSYIRKPLELSEWLRAIGTMMDYWFKVVTLPTRCQ